MKQRIKLVSVRKIQSEKSRSQFDSKVIEILANLFIAAETTINPIIVRQTGLESYEVVDGHCEYYAAVRAREISLVKAETIQAFVLGPELTPDCEQAILDQVERLRHSEASSSNDYDSSQISLLSNLEKNFTAQLEGLRKDHRVLDRQLQAVTTLLDPQSLSSTLQEMLLSESIVDLFAKKLAEKSMARRPLKKGKRTDKDLVENPLNLNASSVAEIMAVPGIGEKTAQRIVQHRQLIGSFSRVDELMDVQNFSDKSFAKWKDFFTASL